MACRDLEVRDAPNIIDALGLSDGEAREVITYVLRVLAKADDGGGVHHHLAEIYRRYCEAPNKLVLAIMTYRFFADSPELLFRLLLAKAIGGGALDKFIEQVTDTIIKMKRGMKGAMTV